MQHYLHYGLGFASHLLTRDEYERLDDRRDEMVRGQVGFSMVPYTEEGERGWSTVVLMDLGEIGDSGKMITAKEVRVAVDTLERLQLEHEQALRNELSKHGLEHLVQHIEPVFFSDNY